LFKAFFEASSSLQWGEEKSLSPSSQFLQHPRLSYFSSVLSIQN
jgi:hypothetical protein